MADSDPGKRPASTSGDETGGKSTKDVKGKGKSKAVDFGNSFSKRARMASSDDDDNDNDTTETGPAALPALPTLLTPMQTLHQKALRLLEFDQEEAYTTFRAALVYCVCQRTVRRQFKAAGVPLDAIDPVGHCSCKDFVAAAQTRRRPPPPGTQVSSASFFAVSDLDLTAVYDLATAAAGCTCGSGRPRCREPGHLAALDRLAVAAERLGRLDAALAAAQWLLDLAPEQAQGYLHMAKAVLLLGAQTEPTTAWTPEAARFAARCLYNHGLHNVRTHGDPDSPLVSILARCCALYGTGDYMPSLPVETAEMILQDMTLADLARCCRVSRSWAAMLTRLRLRLPFVAMAGDRGVRGGGVRDLKLLFRRLPGLQAAALRLCYRPSSSAVAAGSATRGQASFVAEALRRFPAVEALALNARNLLDHEPGRTNIFPEYDEFGVDPDTDPDVWPPLLVRNTLCPPLGLGRLRRLVLHGMQPRNLPELLGLLRCARGSLEILEIEASAPVRGIVGFSFPKLTCLKMHGLHWDPGFFLISLCMRAPALQQLYCDYMTFTVFNIAPEELPGYNQRTVLRNLHTLVLGEFVSLNEKMLPVLGTPTGIPILPDGMRCIDILCDDPRMTDLLLIWPRTMVAPDGSDVPPGIPGTPGVPAANDAFYGYRRPTRPFASLEYFRCLANMAEHRPPLCLFDLLGPSLDPLNGRLAHLELCGRRLEREFTTNPRFAVPFPERLRTVGLDHIDWDTAYRHVPGHIVGRTYLQWLARFTNADTVTLCPVLPVEDADRLLVALVEQRLATRKMREAWAEMQGRPAPPPPGLFTIYHNIRRPGLDARLEALIGDELIEVIEISNYRPAVFPWPDREVKS